VRFFRKRSVGNTRDNPGTGTRANKGEASDAMPVGAGVDPVASGPDADVYEGVVELGARPKAAYELFRVAFERLGSFAEAYEGTSNMSIGGLIAVGSSTPVFIAVRITKVGPGWCRATVTGTAWEGADSRLAAEMGVRRIFETVGLPFGVKM